ncbi:MAG: helix-turn-helix domain-containing protein [Mariprofundaceae bacterium]
MSNIEETPLEPQVPDRQAVLSTLAKKLQQSRKSKSLTLEEIAQTLKLRPVYLESLESGDWGEMPEDVYALGFLRQYASFLRENIDDEIIQLKSETIKLTRPLTFPDPSIAPNKSWVIVALLSFVVLFILFNVFDHDKTSFQEVSIQHTEAIPEAGVLPTSKIAQQIPVKEAQKQVTPPATIEQAIIEKDEKIIEQTNIHHYRLKATDSDVWLQLSKVNSNSEALEIVREVLLKAGEEFQTKREGDYLLLTCGNITALHIEVDGQPFIVKEALVSQDNVVRNISLKP